MALPILFFISFFIMFTFKKILEHIVVVAQLLCPTLCDPWIEGVYSERRNGQMQRHEIKVKKRNE